MLRLPRRLPPDGPDAVLTLGHGPYRAVLSRLGRARRARRWDWVRAGKDGPIVGLGLSIPLWHGTLWLYRLPMWPEA